MNRFVAGLASGSIAALIAWLVSDGNLALTLFVGVLVAAIVWFTRAADEILDWVADFAGAIVRGIDKLIP